MKKFVGGLLSIFFIFGPLPVSSAESSVVKIVSPPHQTFTGEFRNDDLAQELTPSGRLGQLVYVPDVRSKVWVIDSSLIDEVIAMTGDYKIASKATPIGNAIATNWLAQLRRVTSTNDVVSLAYGNPDAALARRLAPSELRAYYAFGKLKLETFLGRSVRTAEGTGLNAGSSRITPAQRLSYSDSRKALTRLSRVVTHTDVSDLRMKLASLLTPTLDKTSREYFTASSVKAVAAQTHRLRVNPGKYQITTENAKLPVTVINQFPVDVTIDISMMAKNSRILVLGFTGIHLAPNSKTQLELATQVIAPGETTVFAQITDSKAIPVVDFSILQLNATVIDSRVTWFTTGAAILLLLAAVTQSVRRVRKGRKYEI
ncbi:MAG: DUF6049 family protein [Candidatus Planktophila sp.]